MTIEPLFYSSVFLVTLIFAVVVVDFFLVCVPSSNMSVLFTIYNMLLLHSLFMFANSIEISKHLNVSFQSVVACARYSVFFLNIKLINLWIFNLFDLLSNNFFFLCFFFDFFIVNYNCVAGSFIWNLYKFITDFAFQINIFFFFYSILGILWWMALFNRILFSEFQTANRVGNRKKILNTNINHVFIF